MTYLHNLFDDKLFVLNITLSYIMKTLKASEIQPQPSKYFDDKNKRIKNIPLERVVLDITYKCNQNCFFCYRHGIPTTNIKLNNNIILNKDCYLILDAIIDSKISTILISGGEPLTQQNVFTEVIKYLRESASKNLEIWLITNGTLLKGKITDFIVSNNINVEVTILGPTIYDDLFRGGMGFHEQVLKAPGKKYYREDFQLQ
jgi:sulfatase maturation enzyme AslB (radical SAM superfamily)